MRSCLRFLSGAAPLVGYAALCASYHDQPLKSACYAALFLGVIVRLALPLCGSDAER